MDYLRTLGSAAVSSLVQKSGLNLPFSLGAKVVSYENASIWTLYDATKREDGSPVSVFEFDGSAPNKRNLLPLAKNAMRKLRATRHPDVLKFMDAVETDTTIYIMTERVKPLSSEVKSWSAKEIQEKQEWLLWGLHRITNALAFVNDPCNSTHGNVRISSIFLSSTGEWRLGGFEVLSNPTDPAAVLYTFAGLLSGINDASSPEVKKGGWSALKNQSPAAPDSYALAILIHTLFNPLAGPPPTTHPPHPPPQASSRGSIPTSVFPSFKQLLNPNPKARMSAKGFLEIGMAESASEGGFFKSNRLLRICEDLERFGLMSDGERAYLLRTIKDVSPTLPTTFATHLILPSLTSSLSMTTMASQASAIVPLVVQLGRGLSGDEYTKLVLDPIIKLFASPDRGTRIALLDNLPEFAPKLDKKMVSDKVWPHLQTGFTDTIALIREATVKSVGLLSDKFTERILNNDLLRHLARLQSDPEASIRTNTCILIGRLGPKLGYNTKRKVLIMAFGKALKDDFVHARVAGLMAFMACVDYFDIEELAGKVVGVVAGALVDKEKIVRDQAFKVIELFMKKLEAHAATMPETAPNGDVPNPLGSFATSTNGQTTIAGTAAGAAGALAGWAISSLGKSLASNELQTSIASTSSTSTTSPPPLPVSTRPTAAPAVPSSSKPKGMQLGASKASKNDVLSAITAEEGPWGDGDLIDVNADEGDWSAFESAPTGKSVDAVGLGFDDFGSSTKNGDEDPWGSMDDAPATNPKPPPEQPPVYPTLSTHPRKPAPTSRSSRLSSAPSASAASSTRSTPLTSLLPDMDTPSPALTTTVNTAGMTKEEKAAEMARRKEERKQRIAQLKEHKKGVAVAKT